MEIALDNKDYDTSRIIELESEIVLPYVTDMADFERVDGEVMIDGVYYKFVERKYENGHIIYRCIPNTNKIKLHHARSIFYQLMNEIQDSPAPQKKGSKQINVKKTISEYELQRSPELKYSICELVARGRNNFSPNTSDAFDCISSPPPEYV
ncbi:MAG: hypothetical protein Q7U83_01625, partial [Daejeonella sp.]|nr:hypothetical protein [Daejeonella sp.]